MFVANRAQKIRAYMGKHQWKYVHTDENPADLTSRGLSFDDDKGIDHWLRGPSFLHKPVVASLPVDCSIIPEDDPEIKHSPANQFSVQVAKLDKSFCLISVLEKRISSWMKVLRVIATMKRFCARAQNKEDRSSGVVLSSADIQAAQLLVIQLIQKKYLKTELTFYGSKGGGQRIANKKRRIEGRLWKLNPILDETGLLRVGGRMNKSDLCDAIKHPIILPKDCILSRRIAEYYHQEVKHCGRTSSLNSIRQHGFWIVNANTMIRSIIHSCVLCRIFRGKLGEQQMAELPEQRFSTEGPFTYTGMDMFGPFYVKEGRKQHKRFVALFTCLSSRAIHLESTVCMETDSFIQALRRFIAR